jgi:hypothetical protein
VRSRAGATSALRSGRVVVLVAVALLLVASCSPWGTSLETFSPDSFSQAPQPVPPEPTTALLPVEHWRSLYDDYAAANEADAVRLSRSTDSFDFYPLAYTIDEKASMFQATGDSAYAQQGLDLVTSMIASARPSSSLRTSSFQDDYLGWVSAENGDDETPLYESYAWRYVTRLLRVVQPALGDAPTGVQEQYARVLSFTEHDIVDKWLARGANDNVYRSRTHMAAHWAMIALDLSQLTASPERRARYLGIVHNVDDHLPNYPSSLRGQLRPNPRDPAAFWWSDVWGDLNTPGQDISHGSGVIAYVVESRDLDGSWSADDLTHFSRTLTDFVLGSAGHHPGFVDGTGTGSGWIADGWVKLGRYDPAVQSVLETYPVQNGQYLAAMAENAHVLAGVTG